MGSSTTNGLGIIEAPAREEIDRRMLLKLGLFGTVAAMVGLVAKNIAGYFSTLNVPPSGPVMVGHLTKFPPGMHPVHTDSPFTRMGFWLVHIIPEFGGEGKFEGLLALRDRIGWN